jgi:CheY-like chemotaxis protein
MNLAPTAAIRPAQRVLIVDDNRDAAISLKDAIEDFGDMVFVCFEGSAALSLARSVKPDVLLLDLSLPGMDGVEVATILRSEPGLRGLKIIAVTAFGDAETRQKTAAAGFDLHLAKPIRLEVLEYMLDLLRAVPK